MTKPTTQAATPPPAAWLVGGGEMGDRIRAKDWSRTPLGPVDDWPQSLRSAVSILLPSKAQIILFWGPELVAIYNDGYRAVFGAKHPAALGMPARECWSELWDVLEPLFMGVVNTGEAYWAKERLFALERHGYLEETYFDVSYDPVRDETGRVGGLFCIVNEKTGSVVGQRRLAALRDLGRLGHGAASAGEVFRSAGAVLAQYATDVPFAALYSWDGRQRSARLEAVAGLKPGAQGAPEIIHDGNRSSAWPVGHDNALVVAEPPSDLGVTDAPWPEPVTQVAVLKIATPGQEPYGYMVAGISPRRALDEDYADFLRLASSNIANGIAGARALEEERKRAAALAELDEAKTAFFSNVSHEFRTPLTLMLGPLEDVLAHSAEDLGAGTRTLLQVAQRNATRLLKLVNTLLDFARIEAGRARASFRPTDLAALTTDLASNFRSACDRAGLRLEVDCPPLSEAAYVDREMWEKIVLNLLSNAFKFTFEGSLRVKLREAATELQLIVSDTGVGIPAEELPRMFERFHRAQNSRGRSHEGSGIGLALVSELVKLHGGSIAVQSELGAGTTFAVTIPKGSAHLPREHLDAAHENTAAAGVSPHAYIAEALGWLPESQTARVQPQAAHRILLADDNADLRDYAQRLLGEHYEVEVVADGQAALEAARARRPDLVISDVMMPHLDGFELIRELRADPKLHAVPVILLSARAGEEARVEGLGKGADDYLVKPFSSRELLVRAGTLINSAAMHRRAGDALAQFETLFRQAPLGMYLVDQNFRFAAVNPVALSVFGNIPDLIGRDFGEVMHLLWSRDYAEELVGIFRHTLSTGEPHFVPERAEERLDSGLIEYYEWQLNRIPLPDGRHGVVCYFRDISQSVLAREALREADHRKDEFLATLSHELRNPLAPLRSAVEVLKLAGIREPRSSTAIAIMERQLNHLVRLVDDLMEVSRITLGSVELRRELVGLDAVLRNAVEASEPLMRARQHRLNVSMPSEALLLEADPVRLAQVFGNLLNNAAKYSDNESVISIEVRRENQEAVIVVSDTGEGIEPDLLRQVFKLFSRGNRTAQRNQSGLGIGLALVRRLVEMHRGSVDAHSDGIGKGSRFTVRLPLSTRRVAAEQTTGAAPLISEIEILLVDDNRDAAESLRMLLEHMGAKVHVAHSGPEALTAFECQAPRLVLLDLGMPGMDGYEVARRLRATSNKAGTSIVALTGWGQDQDRERVREAGFDHHLTKPANLDALASLIASIQNTAAAGQHRSID